MTVELASELIRHASVTPDDAGCQALLAERLQASGNYLSAARHLRRVAGSEASIEAALDKAESELLRADDAYRLLRMRLKDECKA